MKKLLTLFACAAVLALSSCETKKEEKAEETTLSADNAASSTTTLEERRARIKREREEYAERRRLAAEERAKASQSYTDSKGKTVYYVVDEDPSFGSQEQLEQYIQDNVSYPEDAKMDKIEGTVFVDFVIGEDGVIRDVEVSEGTSDEVKQNLSEEAVRVVSSMPKWSPGKKGGKAVATRVSLPITFQLEM